MKQSGVTAIQYTEQKTHNMETIEKVKERPILFSTPMVQAILEGRKTVTRRVISTQPDNECYFETRLIDGVLEIDYNQGDENPRVKCPYGKEKDILWVRETWRKYHHIDPVGGISNGEVIEYAADNHEPIIMVDGDGFQMFNKDGSEKYIPWKPSIFMPREACRIKLEIQSIRVERLHDITEEDAIMEGIEVIRNTIQDSPVFKNYLQDGVEHGYGYPKNSFQSLWTKINGRESWEANPWVWVINFSKLP